MCYNELFESAIRETSEIDRSFKSLEIALFESVLRESHLKEMVNVESGRIYISEIEETKEITDIKTLKEYYKKYALKRLRSRRWKKIIVENTDPPLEIEITGSCIDHWYGDSHGKRKEIIAIQGLPYYIQKMKRITPELNRDPKKKDTEYLYKGECPNVMIKDGANTSYSTHTIKLTLIKRFKENHRSYSFYVNNLRVE